MEVLEGNKIDRELWDRMAKDTAAASWFQSYEAYRFFDSLSFLEAFCFAVVSQDKLKGVVVGYIQKDGGRMKQFFSRRAIILGGPLLSEDITDTELEFFLRSMKNLLKKKVIFIETRNFNDYGAWRTVFERLGFSYEPHYDVVVPTLSVEEIDKKLDRNRRRNIKKALENGIVIEENPDASELKRFYSMLEDLYVTKVKTPLFPYEFFEKLYALPSSLFLMAKDQDGTLLGGLVCVKMENRAVYAWYACCDDQNHRILSPSVMVNYAGICYAANHGMARFDFMGAGKPDDGGYGVRDFKLKFGGDLVEFGRFVYVSKPILFQVGKLGVKLMKRV